MDTCTARRGFLVLSSCGAQALRPCAACGAMTCPEHLSPSSGLSECLACANSSGRANTKANTNTDDSRTSTDSSSTYDSDDSYRYRQSYYRESNYDPSFDHSDSRAFVAGSAAGAVAADEDEGVGGAGFGDS